MPTASFFKALTRSSPTRIDDPDLTALHAYWTGKCGNKTMPQRADINPREIVSLLPHVMLVDIHQPLRFWFRLVGTKICERWGENRTSKWLDELDFDGERLAVLGQYASVARTGAPQYDIEEFVNEQGRYLHYRRLLLPLSEDGIRPNMLLGAQKGIGVDGFQVSAHRWL